MAWIMTLAMLFLTACAKTSDDESDPTATAPLTPEPAPPTVEQPADNSSTPDSSTSTGTNDVDTTVIGDTTPTLELVGVFQGGGAISGSSATLTYTAADADGDALTYGFEVSTDGGVTWAAFACTLPTATACTWDTSTLAEGIKYRVRVTASDAKGASTVKSSLANFGVSTMTYTYAADTQSVITNHCDACHFGAAGGFDTSTEEGVKAYAAQLAGRVTTGTMPPGGPLPEADQVKIQLWEWQGAL